jgi:hypothetical protein|tara:strand:+ start:3983 stop:4249 length:267 start_codon:yes stop_codon:yes gene_type:complete
MASAPASFDVFTRLTLVIARPSLDLASTSRLGLGPTVETNGKEIIRQCATPAASDGSHASRARGAHRSFETHRVRARERRHRVVVRER